MLATGCVDSPARDRAGADEPASRTRVNSFGAGGGYRGPPRRGCDHCVCGNRRRSDGRAGDVRDALRGRVVDQVDGRDGGRSSRRGWPSLAGRSGGSARAGAAQHRLGRGGQRARPSGHALGSPCARSSSSQAWRARRTTCCRASRRKSLRRSRQSCPGPTRMPAGACSGARSRR